MAAYLKCCFLEPQLNLLRKCVAISDKKGIYFQARNFLSCAKRSKNHDGMEVIASDDDTDTPVAIRGNSNPQIDHHFLDELYKRDTSDAFRPQDETKYFKQAWQNKFNTLTQNKFSRLENEHVEIDTTFHLENNFGTLHQDIDKNQRSSKVPDFRDPNERMSEKLPDDKDKERDWRQNIPLTRYGRLGRKAFYYTKKMTKLGREGKINEAMQVYDDWMMVKDRVMPSKRTYITLIGIVGRAGYTRKAFQLFRQMKHLGLDPSDQVYTSLFNACANCPMPEYGLKRANALYEQMKTKGIPLSPITTMASMKAFALCGDFPKAFQILDESRVPLNAQCFNSLLLACGMDKQSGFRRALKVWKTMRERNIQPAYETYNLLVRCIRDCGVGDVNTLVGDLGLDQGKAEIHPGDFFKSVETDFILLTSGQQKHDKQKKETKSSYVEVVEGIKTDDILNIQSLQLLDSNDFEVNARTDDKAFTMDINNAFCEKITLADESSPNSTHDTDWRKVVNDPMQSKEWTRMESEKLDSVFFNENKNNESVQTYTMASDTDMIPAFSHAKSIALSELKTKPGRLALIGGPSMLISHMVHHGIKPDIKTFTQLLSCVPNNAESETMLFRMMEDIEVDIDFLNDVMMRRNMRHESHTVRDVLIWVSKFRLTPNIRTYAALALACHNVRDAQALLEDMKAANVEPTAEVMGHLIYISRLNFVYKRHMMKMMEELALTPSPQIIRVIEKSIALAKRLIVTAERNGDKDNRFLNPKFQKQFKDFLKFYQSWLLRTELQKEEHPWERFTDMDSKKEDKSMQNVDKSN